MQFEIYLGFMVCKFESTWKGDKRFCGYLKSLRILIKGDKMLPLREGNFAGFADYFTEEGPVVKPNPFWHCDFPCLPRSPKFTPYSFQQGNLRELGFSMGGFTGIEEIMLLIQGIKVRYDKTSKYGPSTMASSPRSSSSSRYHEVNKERVSR